VFWAKNVRDSDVPLTPQRNNGPLDAGTTQPTSLPTPLQHRIQFHSPAVIATIPLSPNHQAEPEDSEESISHVLQEIRTLERLANRLHDLYVLRDRLIRARTRRI
jgi:hypothetical protein